MSDSHEGIVDNPVRVLVDATGLGTLSDEIDSDLIHLMRAAGRTGDPVVVVCRPRDAKLFKSFDLEVHRAPDRIQSERFRRWWVRWSLPALARQLGADVIHSPHGLFPVRSRIARVVSVRDPSMATRRRTWRIDRAAGDVVVPSQVIADDLRGRTGLPAHRVHIAPVGVSKESSLIPDWEVVDSTADLYGMTEWVTVLAAEDATDAIDSFREGFRRAFEFGERRPTLVVLGLTDVVALRHFTELVDAGFDVRIVSDPEPLERTVLLGGARIAVVLDESGRTGRALIEAMACGSTIVSRRTDSLVEVGGDAVEFVDDSAAAVEIVVTALVSDSDRRRRLAATAVAQSHRFSWEASLVAHRAAWSRAHRRG